MLQWINDCNHALFTIVKNLLATLHYELVVAKLLALRLFTHFKGVFCEFRCCGMQCCCSRIKAHNKNSAMQ